MLHFRTLSRLRSPLLLPPFLFKILTSFSSSSSSSTPHPQPPVAVFWDLDNKPPNSIPPYDAAVRLHLAASSFGPLSFSVAYANPHAFRHIPASFHHAHRLQSSSNAVPYLCRICGRSFSHHSKLLNHFKQIHQREHTKRLNRLNSVRGARRVQLISQLSLKMEKYKKVVREMLVPGEGYALADELKRAGVLVRMVDDRPESADRAIKGHIVDAMDRRMFGCLVLVSDDSGFVGVLKEAHMRCLMTVVIGDEEVGALRRCADAVFSWKDVVSGKARKAAGSAVGKWKDKGLLKGLEWRYEDGMEGDESEWDEFEGESEDDDGGSLNLVRNEGNVPWWKLDEDYEVQHSKKSS